MFQQLYLPLRDGVPDNRSTERGARQCRRTSVDEKEWEGGIIRLICTTVDPATGKLVDLIFTRGRNSLQQG